MEGAPCHGHEPVTTQPPPMEAQLVLVPAAGALPVALSHVQVSDVPSFFFFFSDTLNRIHTPPKVNYADPLQPLS